MLKSFIYGARKISVGAKYVHYKGDTYKIENIARKSNKHMIVYSSCKNNEVWVNDVSEFLGYVKLRGKNVVVPRFAEIPKREENLNISVHDYTK